MSLRVTPGMLQSQLMRNINNNMKKFSKIQEQLTTGRTINKPSDDPVGITYSLRYRSELTANDQYQKNVDAALSWLDFTDKILQQAGDIIHRVKELTVQGMNETNTETALGNISSEIKQLRSQMVQIGNSTLAGKYIFNGEKFDQAPYTDANATTTITDQGRVTYEVGTLATLEINITGTEVFGDPSEADQIFKVLDQIISAFDAGNNNVAAELAHLESRMDKIISARAEVGAKTNRVELMENRLRDLELNLTALQSKTEDADIAKLLTESKVNENIFNASLSVGAKIITPSLVDFLR